MCGYIYTLHIYLFSTELIRFSYDIYVLEIEIYNGLTDNIYLLYTCKLVQRIFGQKDFLIAKGTCISTRDNYDTFE
jgi:hypothetical protein